MHKMPMLTKYTSHFLFGLMLGAGALLAVAPTSAVAQNRPEPLEDLRTKDGADFFNGRGNGQGSSMMNFIQNAIIGLPRNSDEVAAEQRENLDAATAQFLKRRSEMMRKSQPQVAPVAPVENPPASN